MKLACALLVSAVLLSASSLSGQDRQGLLSAAQPAVAASAQDDPELAAARGLLAKSQLDAAEHATREYIAHHPTESQGHFLLGLILFRQVQSLAHLTGGLLAPGDIPSQAMDAHRRSQKIQDSLAAYTEGAKFGKPSPADLKIVSLDYVLLEDYASADKWLTLSLQWDAGDAESWYYLGRTKYSENRFQEAIAAYQKCLELRPDYVLAANGLGLSYAGLNQNTDAISWLRKAISWQDSAPQKTAEPYIDLGDLFNQQAQFEEALPSLQKALAIDSKNIRAHEKLAKAFLGLNRLPEAQHELETAISLDPNQSSFHYLLSQVFRKLGQLDRAKAELAAFQALKAKEPPRKSGMQ